MTGPSEAASELVEWRPGVRTRLHHSAATGAAKLCVMEQLCEPGTGAPLHTHFEVEESIVVVAGEAEFTCDGAVTRLGAGRAILLPAHSWHGFVNTGTGILHTVAAFSSAAPPVAYADAPGEVLEIGGVRKRMHDAHRAVRES